MEKGRKLMKVKTYTQIRKQTKMMMNWKKKESKESEVVPKDKSNDQEDLDLIEQELPEKCLDESNNSDVIREIDVGEGIHLEVIIEIN